MINKNLIVNFFKLITAGVDDCPLCGGKMKQRKGPYGEFYGCGNYPRCRHTLTVAKYNQQKSQETGQPQARPQTTPQTQNTITQNRNAPAATKEQPTRTITQEDMDSAISDKAPSQSLTKISPEPLALVVNRQTNIPYACKKPIREGSFYEMIGEDGKSEFVSPNNFERNYQVMYDAEKRVIKRNSAQEIFAVYKEMQTNEDGEEMADQANVKGRIPQDKISEYQRNIQNTFMDSEQNILINALAGTGKTTLLRHLASYKKPGEKWLYLVYNTRNKQEADVKFPQTIEVATTHSFLGKVARQSGIPELSSVKFYKSSDPFIRNVLGNKPGETKASQLGSTIVEMADKPWESDYADRGKRFHTNMSKRAARFIVKLADFAKNYAVKLDVQKIPAAPAPNARGRRQNFDLEITNNDELYASFDTIIAKYNLNPYLLSEEETQDYSQEQLAALPNYKSQLYEMTKTLLRDCLPGYCKTEPELASYSDFNDMLWMPTLYDDIKFPKYDVVLADEVQDFNDCQSFMLRKLSDAGAKIVAVGDPNQSMYEFRGADSKSFEKVRQTLQAATLGGVEMPLLKNYRSAPAIIDYVKQNTHVKNLEAGLSHEGLVTDGQYGQAEAMSMIFDEIKQNQEPLMSTVFIARTNQGLVEPALECLANDVDFVIVGVDMVKDVMKFIIENTSDQIVSDETNLERTCGYLQQIPIDQLPRMIDDSVGYFAGQHAGDPRHEKKIRESQKFSTIINKIVNNLARKNFVDPEYEEKSWNQDIRKYEWRKKEMNIRSSYDLYKWITWKFRNREPQALDDANENKKDTAISFTTAHKSKGLEWERAFILEKDKFSSKKTGNNLEADQETATQEDNAKYVAFTRAMKHLHVLKTPKQTEASTKSYYGWYKRAQMLTPQQINLYHDFTAPSAVKLIGSGMGATFSIPGLGAVIRGSELMNQVINKIRPILTKNNVHTIDTSPVSRADAIGLAVSSEPGTVHVDVAKIINNIKNQSLPSITQLDGTRMDTDAKQNIINRISGIVLQQLGEVAAHESKHNIDYFASFPKGKFDSPESGAEAFGKGIAQQYFKNV